MDKEDENESHSCNVNSASSSQTTGRTCRSHVTPTRPPNLVELETQTNGQPSSVSTHGRQSPPTNSNISTQADRSNYQSGQTMAYTSPTSVASVSNSEAQRVIRTSTVATLANVNMGSPPPYSEYPPNLTSSYQRPGQCGFPAQLHPNQVPPVLYAINTVHGQIPVIPVQLPGQIQYDDDVNGSGNYVRLRNVNDFQSHSQQSPNEVGHRSTSHTQPPRTVRSTTNHQSGIRSNTSQANAYYINRTRNTGAQRELPSDYLGLTISCLFVCICIGNVVALLFIIPAMFCSLKAQQFNNQGSLNRAKKYGSASFICNILAVFEYVITVSIVCGVVALWYTGLLPTSFL